MKFIADGNLGKIAKQLRMLGIDCLYNGGMSLPEALQLAVSDNRVFLTLKSVPSAGKIQVIRLPGSDPISQVGYLFTQLDFSHQIKSFSRCLICNQVLQAASDDIIKEQSDHLPLSVKERKLQIYFCNQCKKSYWHGTHVERMQEEIDIILSQSGK